MNQEEDVQQEALFPESIRKTGLFTSSGLSILIIGYYIAFILKWVDKSPKDLSLSGLLLFLMASVLLFWVPWHKLGLSLKKFGPLEFERKLEGQSEEHVKDISELENKITELERLIAQMGNNGIVSEVAQNQNQNNDDYRRLVIDFLTEYDRWSFSPLRIEKWGAKQAGYEQLGNKTNLLRPLLRSLVAEGILETRISEKGNTLYRIKN